MKRYFLILLLFGIIGCSCVEKCNIDATNAMLKEPFKADSICKYYNIHCSEKSVYEYALDIINSNKPFFISQKSSVYAHDRDSGGCQFDEIIAKSENDSIEATFYYTNRYKYWFLYRIAVERIHVDSNRTDTTERLFY
jgi:hypothetical protein